MAAPLTRDLIVETTRRLIADEGLAAVSLRRVAGELDVTAPALYAYVDDKSDLLRAVAEGELMHLVGELEAIDDDDPIERLRRYSRTYIERALAHPALFHTMFLFPPALAVGPGTEGDELPAATKAFETALRAAEDAIDRGLLRASDPLMVGLTLWSATHGAAEVLLLGFDFDDRTRDALIDSVVDTMLDGLRRP